MLGVFTDLAVEILDEIRLLKIKAINERLQYLHSLPTKIDELNKSILSLTTKKSDAQRSSSDWNDALEIEQKKEPQLQKEETLSAILEQIAGHTKQIADIKEQLKQFVSQHTLLLSEQKTASKVAGMLNACGSPVTRDNVNPAVSKLVESALAETLDYKDDPNNKEKIVVKIARAFLLTQKKPDETEEKFFQHTLAGLDLKQDFLVLLKPAQLQACIRTALADTPFNTLLKSYAPVVDTRLATPPAAEKKDTKSAPATPAAKAAPPSPPLAAASAPVTPSGSPARPGASKSEGGTPSFWSKAAIAAAKNSGAAPASPVKEVQADIKKIGLDVEYTFANALWEHFAKSNLFEWKKYYEGNHAFRKDELSKCVANNLVFKKTIENEQGEKFLKIFLQGSYGAFWMSVQTEEALLQRRSSSAAPVAATTAPQLRTM